ncbi:molybdopterin-guanine dinucleotide biosynthesis protein B [Paenibacillus ihbetae]|uniref:Molybdopterin-guanine dinucleotide biosynthesis protein B n=1 Tax=Paenibacillus ihbetae TaxID=1870820 RepID=A0A1B2DV42_9BACL|nr:molybdopterin-guanine dinucleotide biosynthesis protein B [Paenibacillus ihbetae]ANY71579.1 molybdopterin-guanine dinucleotide biosynthesis protein B [Paenibacillus ihbetae]
MNVVQLCGYKNSGKTTLIAALLPLLKKRGLRIAVIKHDSHGFDIDHEGTDTFRFREAGAEGVAIASPGRTAIMKESEANLGELLACYDDFDLVLIEGYKRERYPKLVLLRSADDLTLLDEAVAVQAVIVRPDMLKEPSALPEIRQRQTVPVLTWDDVSQIAAIIMNLC